MKRFVCLSDFSKLSDNIFYWHFLKESPDPQTIMQW